MTDPPTDKLRPLRIRLTVVFLAALLIGPGLGSHLAGGDPGRRSSKRGSTPVSSPSSSALPAKASRSRRVRTVGWTGAAG